jgi:ABC-type uncharacterized transport system permease subunit
MMNLPVPERSLFLAILILAFLAAFLGYRQLVRDSDRLRRLLIAVVALIISLAVILLGCRAVSISAFPLTGLFESLIALLILLGFTFQLLFPFLQRLWLSSSMAWVFLVLTLLAALAAKPAATLQPQAQTPWILVHALSMILSGAAIVFSSVMAALYLLSARQLKQRQVSRLFGKMPSLEKLESLNLLGLQVGFVALSFGLAAGIGMAFVKSASLHLTLYDWITDSKIVMTLLGWFILLTILLLNYLLSFRPRTLARMTLVVCFFIIFAFIGSTLLCKSGHDFRRTPPPAAGRT